VQRALFAPSTTRNRSPSWRLWRWHANFFPGWKGYLKSLPDDEKTTIIEKYDFPANKFA
jgi:hypothetical protein